MGEGAQRTPAGRGRGCGLEQSAVPTLLDGFVSLLLSSSPRRVHSRGFFWLFLRLRLGNVWPPRQHTPRVPQGAESRAAGDPPPWDTRVCGLRACRPAGGRAGARVGKRRVSLDVVQGRSPAAELLREKGREGAGTSRGWGLPEQPENSGRRAPRVPA